MKQRLLVLGAVLVVLSVLLPAFGIRQFEDDFAPMLMGLVALASGIGCLIGALRPHVLEHYIAGAATVFVVLTLITAIGLAASQTARLGPNGPLPIRIGQYSFDLFEGGSH